MYLKLNAIQHKTEEWIKATWKKGKWSPNAVINSEGEIIDPRSKNGLVPTAITRDLTWGVPVPVVDEASVEPLFFADCLAAFSARRFCLDAEGAIVDVFFYGVVAVVALDGELEQVEMVVDVQKAHF